MHIPPRARELSEAVNIVIAVKGTTVKNYTFFGLNY